MKLEQLVGERFKERPADCAVDSHALMVRGGYMKAVTSGIFSSYTPLKRVMRKIEEILRQEMDAIEGQEVQMPVVMPAALWEESGRYESIGKELARFCDRSGSPLVLGMTHEEAAVQLVREYGQSYTKYPFLIYQIQTKFRDEARPRAGLIRVREFTMKDAYSFHTSQADLERTYARCLEAYHRVFARVGVPEVVAVASDCGMMGGSVSHEFMLLTPIGEDSIVLCESCGYRANLEAAENVVSPAPAAGETELTLVSTPGVHTIEELCGFFGITKERCCKAVVYQQNHDGRYVILFLRGDLEANETKLTNHLGCEIRPAVLTAESGLCAGFIGPCGLTKDFTLLFDRSLQDAAGLCCGANREGFHYTGLDLARDVGGVEYHDFAKARQGGICPVCGKPALAISRGVEVGNIFQLGDKYTKAMNMTYTAPNGEPRHPVMGCYGIGIGRLAAAVCEAHHDDFGPIWPLSIAPWQLHLCALRSGDAGVKQAADALYEELQRRGIEVLYDDRPVSAGVMFSDADLLGVPLRVILSPRNLKEKQLEAVSRDNRLSVKMPLENAAGALAELLGRLSEAH